METPNDAGTSTTTSGTGGKDQTTKTTIERLVSGGIDKVDLLLMVDNSRSMADKQAILAATVPDLVRGLVSPPCVDKSGLPTAAQPAGPFDPCPPEGKRRFHPITDIHIGIVTSSIGGHGSDTCANVDTFSCPGGATNTSTNDAGHLVTRADPCKGGATATYQGKGFLAWDPTSKLSPPGEANLGAVTVDPTTGAVITTTPGLAASLKDLVIGAGQIGCGFESSMESWYRFLVDPEPYQSIAVDPSTLRAEPKGTDQVLLAQRRDFLRPSSLLAIVALSDENDCSIKEYGQFWFAAQARDPNNPNKNFYLPKARTECATNPNDKCCRSCGQDQTGCPADPACNSGGSSLDAKTDDINLRCFDQKRRFGIDFLYPLDRYVTGLTQSMVPNRSGDIVPNPIFTDLDPSDADNTVRDASMVMFTSIVGVPWQYLARDPKEPAKGFKDAAELAATDPSQHTTWDYILGDPANFVPPLDPLMIESSSPRNGTSPINGAAIAPPSTAGGPGPNPINGHEYTPGTQNGVQVAPDDLQYACIFDLPAPRDCSTPSVACDCTDPKNDNPLCERVNPGNPSSPRTKQVRAKAYPGIRHLALVKALGQQGVAGSICPVQINDTSVPTYGYRPAIQTLLDRLAPQVDGGCASKKLDVDDKGQVSCAIFEARSTNGNGACVDLCKQTPGRTPLAEERAALGKLVLADPLAKQIGADCVCEIPQLGGPPGCTSIGSELAACQCDASSAPSFGGKPVDGWCYIDAEQNAGNAQLVQSCPAGQQRTLRFVGAAAPAAGTAVMLACTQ